MISFASRNIKLFFRDKSAVFFSLLGVFIIIGLYALFLGDVWVESFKGAPGARYLMGSWIMAGLLAVTGVTTTMGAFGIMVEDKTKLIFKDLASSPIKRVSLVGGYILSAYVVGVIMCLVTLVLAEIYILSCGGELLALAEALKTIGTMLVLNFASTSMVLLVVSLFTSSNAFGTASSIIGTMIGFLTGIYLPIGQLPPGIQSVIKLFPISHGAALLRQIMMKDAIPITFAGASPDVISQFNYEMGVTLSIGDSIVSPVASILILAASGILFFILAVINMSRKSK